MSLSKSLKVATSVSWITERMLLWILSDLFSVLLQKSLYPSTTTFQIIGRNCYLPLHKLPEFHLTSWCRKFVETHSFRRVSGESPKETVGFCKIYTPGNWVKFGHCAQCSPSVPNLEKGNYRNQALRLCQSIRIKGTEFLILLFFNYGWHKSI